MILVGGNCTGSSMGGTGLAASHNITWARWKKRKNGKKARKKESEEGRKIEWEKAKKKMYNKIKETKNVLKGTDEIDT